MYKRNEKKEENKEESDNKNSINNNNDTETLLQEKENKQELDYKNKMENVDKNNSEAEKELFEESLLSQTWRMFTNIVKNEGISGLYRGISSCLVGSIFSYGIYFFAYQYWKNYFVRHNLSVNVVFDSLCTSFLGALCTSVTTNPIWVLNSRMSKSHKDVRLFTNKIYYIW